jgi:hypothetical protein
VDGFAEFEDAAKGFPVLRQEAANAIGELFGAS